MRLFVIGLGLLALAFALFMALTRGVDFAGGTELVYRMDFEARDPEARARLLDAAANVVRRRIEAYGVEEFIVARLGSDRFSVHLSKAHADAVPALKEVIADLGRLELHLTVEPSARNYARYWGRFRAKWERRGDFEAARAVPPRELLAGDRARYPDGLRWYPLGDRVAEWPAERLPPGGLRWVLCRMDRHGITDASFASVEAADGAPSDGWMVRFRLVAADQPKLAALTGGPGDNHLAIIVNGAVREAPRVESPLYESGQITGGFTEAEARSLAAVLAGGSLPVRPELIEERAIDR